MAEYGDEDPASQHQNEGLEQVGMESHIAIDEDQELKMKIVMYYHTLVSGFP